MIEILLEAERALTHGRIDEAERLYRQVADGDPKSSIAVVGLARVALERGDEQTAYRQARAALTIDPENPAAQHMVMRLAEVMAGRGETAPVDSVRQVEQTGTTARDAGVAGSGGSGRAARKMSGKRSLLGRLLRRPKAQP